MDIKPRHLLIKKRFWAGLLLAQFLLFFIFSKIYFFIKFAETFFEFKKELHQQLFGWLSFSAGDILYVLVLGGLLYLSFKLITKKPKTTYWLLLLALLNIFYFLYQINWGLLYFQKPLIEKLPAEEPSIEETKKLAYLYLEKCKLTRQQVKEDRNGVFKVYSPEGLKMEILKRQKLLPSEFNIKKPTSTDSFKPSLFEGIMSYTGILGYYNPFTAEAQYNAQLPSTYQPFTLSHESAHQLGFAREQEANFIGYLIGRDSDNPELRYSTEYFVLKSLLNALAGSDEAFVKKSLNDYSPAMKRDRIYEKAFIKRHEGSLDAFFAFANNIFLKSNQQDGSITYSYFTDLLIRYERIKKESHLTTRF